MPKSKREKIVHLTKTKPKGKEHKSSLVDKIHESIDKFERVFVLSAKNRKNDLIKEIRDEWIHSRIFFAKNSIMSHALGCDREKEYKRNLHKISLRLHGQTGLLCTNASEEEVLKWFDDFKRETFASAGDVAPETIVIPAGELKMFQHTMDERLRALGLPVQLNAGIIMLLKEFKVCEKGATLTSTQAKILKLLDRKLYTFKVTVECMWSNDKYKAFTVAEAPTEVSNKDGEEEEEDDDDEEMLAEDDE